MKTIPMKHQTDVFNKIKNKNFFALFMEYGTGKSYCALQWIEHNWLRLQKGVLIVGKKMNIQEGNAWPTEIKTHTNMTYTILNGSWQNKLDKLLQYPRSDIYLINYESIPSMLKWLQDFSFKAIIFDESTQIKNIKAIRTKRALKLAEGIPHRAILTGFPVSEHLDEIWSQYYAIDFGTALTDNYWKFLHTYFKHWRFGWSLKKGADKTIIDKVKKNSLFMKLRDCVDLPPRIYKYIALEPTKEQKKYMTELKEEFAITIGESKTIEYKHVLPTIEKSLQICSGFMYLDKDLENNGAIRHFSTPKTECIKNLIEEIPNKKIIWCRYVAEVEMLSELLKHNYVLMISSKNFEAANLANLNKFKTDKKYNTLITTYALLESGETLAMANYSIHYSHIWSNNMTLNAKHRVYRKGSEIHNKVVYIHLYLKDTVEEVVLKTLQKKKSMQKKLKEDMEQWVNKEWLFVKL